MIVIRHKENKRLFAKRRMLPIVQTFYYVLRLNVLQPLASVVT